MKLKEVTAHIYLVQGENAGRFPYSNSVLILDEKAVLIDTGCGIENLKQLNKEYNIDLVINSHTHADHSAGNWVFEDTPIHVPREGFDTSGNMAALSERFVGSELASAWRRFVKETMRFRNCMPTNSYDNNTVFDFGKTKVEPIYTPGHTKDHCCFYVPQERILLSSDYDLTSFPWYGHRESSLSAFIDSIWKLKSLSPRLVISSHRGIVDGDIASEFDKYHQCIDERDRRLLSLLGGGKTVERLADGAPIYGSFSYSEPLLRYFECEMIEKHLERLETQGKVTRTGALYVRVGK